MESREFYAPPKHKRLAAFAVDFIFLFLLWYFLTESDLAQVNALLETLDPEAVGALDAFAQAITRMLTRFVLKWLFCQTVYFCLFPAILGSGRTPGKLLLRIRVISAATMEEMSPSRLVLREFVGRTLIETLLILPGLVSGGMLLVSKDGRSLRDRLAKTVVVQETSYLDS